MERIGNSIRASCSSPFSSSIGSPFKRRSTCQANEEDARADLLKDTSNLRDRAARKEIERVRLRELLNQGKKKRRRLKNNKLVASPRNGVSIGPVEDFARGGTTSFNEFQSRETQLKPSMWPPAIEVCANVPRKSRSVGSRRKGKSWRSIGFNAPNEIEIEFEVAEVLSGLKKQASPSNEPLIDDLEKIPVENDDNQSNSVQDCIVDKATKYHNLDMLKSESTSESTSLEIQNNDKAKTKQEEFIADGEILTSEVIPASMEETQRKHPEKFTIDLNELPPMESSVEGDGMERLTPESKIVLDEEMKSEPEEATIRRLEVPWNIEIKSELQDLGLGSPNDTMKGLKQPSQRQQKAYSYTSSAKSITSELLATKRKISTNPTQGFEFYSHNNKQESNSRPTSTLKITDEHASHQIHKQTGPLMAGPLLFPLSQNQSMMANQSGLSRFASSNGNVRFSYPIGAPFLTVLPGNICTNSSSDSKRMHSSGGKNAQPVPFLDEHLHDPQIFLPIQIQQQRHLQRNAALQSPYPLQSSNIVSMPSAGSGDGGQWKSTEQHHLKGEEKHSSASSFTFASSTQRLSSDAAGNSPLIKQSGFISKSCSTISPASVDPSVRSPNCKLSVAKQNQYKATSLQLKNQQQLQSNNQTLNAANVSNGFSIFSGNLHARSSNSLQQHTSDIKQASDVLRNIGFTSLQLNPSQPSTAKVNNAL